MTVGAEFVKIFKMQSPTLRKEKIYWSVLNAAISLEIRHGHQRWTMTQLSRLSKVGRPLIYYYFGKSRLGILKEAILLFGRELSGETQERMELWRQKRFAETFCQSRELIQKAPGLMAVYMLNRGHDNEIGELIKKMEAGFKKKLKLFFPQLSGGDLEAVFALFWGITAVGELKDSGVYRAVDIILSGVLSPKKSKAL